MKKKDKLKIYWMVGIFIILLALVSIPFTITTSEDFTLSVDIYVDNGGYGEINQTYTEYFNKSIDFDLDITKSVGEDDVLIYVEDASGNKKIIFQQHYISECDNEYGGKYINHPYQNKMKIIYADTLIKLVEPLNNDNVINYITRDSNFGDLPLRLEFVVAKQRGLVCRNDGTQLKYGVIEVSNIVLEDLELEEQQIINDETNETEIIINDEIDFEETESSDISVITTEESNSVDEDKGEEHTFEFQPLMPYVIYGGLIIIIGTILYLIINKKGKKK